MGTISAHPRVMALRTAGQLLAVGAALACVVGDLTLQYTPNSSDLLAPDYRSVVDIPEWRLLLGHCVGVLAQPPQLAGIWLLYQALLPAGRWLAFLSVAGGAYMIAAWRSTHVRPAASAWPHTDHSPDRRVSGTRSPRRLCCDVRSAHSPSTTWHRDPASRCRHRSGKGPYVLVNRARVATIAAAQSGQIGRRTLVTAVTTRTKRGRALPTISQVQLSLKREDGMDA